MIDVSLAEVRTRVLGFRVSGFGLLGFGHQMELWLPSCCSLLLYIVFLGSMIDVSLAEVI
jgi:hypothetical protein